MDYRNLSCCCDFLLHCFCERGQVTIQWLWKGAGRNKWNYGDRGRAGGDWRLEVSEALSALCGGAISSTLLELAGTSIRSVGSGCLATSASICTAACTRGNSAMSARPNKRTSQRQRNFFTFSVSSRTGHSFLRFRSAAQAGVIGKGVSDTTRFNTTARSAHTRTHPIRSDCLSFQTHRPPAAAGGCRPSPALP